MMNPSDPLSPLDAADSELNPPLALPEHPAEPGLVPVEDVRSEAALESHSGLQFGHFSDEERTRIALLAETAGVQKAWRGAGYVVISRRTVEEEIQIPVTLRHEEITMTRYFADPNSPEDAPEGVVFSADFGEAHGAGTFVMRLHEEVPEVIKTVRVAEQVEFARRVVSEETQLVGTVRREELKVENPSHVPVSGAVNLES